VSESKLHFTSKLTSKRNKASKRNSREKKRKVKKEKQTKQRAMKSNGSAVAALLRLHVDNAAGSERTKKQ